MCLDIGSILNFNDSTLAFIDFDTVRERSNGLGWRMIPINIYLSAVSR